MAMPRVTVSQEDGVTRADDRLGTDVLDIIYQDEHVIAVNKPSGLLVHRSAVDRRETRFALQLLRDQVGEWVYPVHRLDKPASGVLLFGRSPESGRALSEDFRNGAVAKTYVAVVRGYVAEADVIDYPLREETDKMTDGRALQDKEAQPSTTAYRRLATVELPFPAGRYPRSRYSLVELRPVTGRKHQLRRHMKHVFHPIIGDTRHGEGRHNRVFRERFGSFRLLLAATEMIFPHPASRELITVVAPLDASFLHVLDQLGWKGALPPRWLLR